MAHRYSPIHRTRRFPPPPRSVFGLAVKGTLGVFAAIVLAFFLLSGLAVLAALALSAAL